VETKVPKSQVAIGIGIEFIFRHFGCREMEEAALWEKSPKNMGRVTGGKDPCQRQRTVEKTGGALVARWSQASLTVSRFRRLESQKSRIRIHEVVKSEILNRWKVL
jgi:hypothetical protein